jgi:hypothetical protein
MAMQTKKGKRRATSPRRPARKTTDGYNDFKTFKGKQYTGMKIGRSHKWYYDKGEWNETKITPDLWQISYAVIKRRAGKAPEGSGVPTGTGYHWFILAHQMVNKLNANDYTTELSGFKYKIAHKRADKVKWSGSVNAQRRRLIQALEDAITHFKQKPIALAFEYQGEMLKGEALPVSETCHDGICDELEITLNDEYRGILRHLKSGWKMEGEPDKKFVKALGEAVAG